MLSALLHPYFFRKDFSIPEPYHDEEYFFLHIHPEYIVARINILLLQYAVAACCPYHQVVDGLRGFYRDLPPGGQYPVGFGLFAARLMLRLGLGQKGKAGNDGNGKKAADDGSAHSIWFS